MIIDDNPYNRNIVAAGGGKLLHIHAKAPVTGNVDADLIRLADLGSDTSTQTVTHGAKSAGGKERTRLGIPIVLGSPHLMLSHIRGNNGLSLRNLIDGLDHIRAGKISIVIFQRISSL